MKKSILSLFILSLFSSFVFSTSPSEKAYIDIEDKNTLTIQTPSLKSRQFAKIKLPNGLQAYIISDPNTDKSAAALSVNVGSWSDPPQYPGMAHFLEHMLFMGTKAYPDENDYFQYIMDHGGLPNAYTAPDRTVYMFSINNNYFDGALNRFAHFFIDPLFNESGVGRELHAVDQEHSKNIENDYRRAWEIFKELGNPNHPNHAFATGNAQTLSSVPRQALVDWYNSHYSASIMRLVVYGNQPIDCLKRLVVKDFSPIKGSFYPEEIHYQSLLSSNQKGHIVYIKPIRDLRFLTLEWELPKNIATDQETKSAELICYILQSGAENSLKEFLKRERLIDDLNSEVFEISSVNKTLQLNFSLTKKGVKDIDQVIEKAFQTINMLKNQPIPSYIFQEMQTMAHLNYEYQSREDAFNFVAEKAHQLVDENLETFPQKTLTASKTNFKNVENILNIMTPQNCVYIVMAPTDLTGVFPDKKEKNNGGEYAIKPISEEFLKKWSQKPSTFHIGLPPANPYIPKDLQLLHENVEPKPIAIPTLISQNNLGTYYYWSDDRYLAPEISFKLSFKSPLIDGTAKSTAYLDLYTNAFSSKLSPILSVAKQAGLSASLDYQNLKLCLSLNGYSEKSIDFLKSLLTKMTFIAPSQAEFDLYKESLMSSYDNALKAMPYAQSNAFASNILYNDAPLAQEKAPFLQSMTYEDFLTFSHDLLTQIYVESIFTGNISKDDAEKIPPLIQDTFHCQPFLSEKKYEKKLLVLPNNKGPYMVTEHVNVMGNAAILAVEEGPFSFENKASQLILAKALQESFFSTLRSKQQTGYIAKSWPKEVDNQLLQFFVVQSNTHQPDDLISRFELFLEGYTKDFSEEIPLERFTKIRDSLIEEINQPPTNLNEMCSYLNLLAFYRDANFHYNQDLTKTLSAMSYDNLKAQTLKFLSRQNAKRLAVLVEGNLPPDQLFKYHQISSRSLKELGHYDN